MSRPDTKFRLVNTGSQVLFLQRSDGTQFPVGREPVVVSEISAHISAVASPGLIDITPLTVTPVIAVQPVTPEPVADPATPVVADDKPIETNTKIRSKNRSDQ